MGVIWFAGVLVVGVLVCWCAVFCDGLHATDN